MKKIFLTIAVMIAIIACKNDKTQTEIQQEITAISQSVDTMLAEQQKKLDTGDKMLATMDHYFSEIHVARQNAEILLTKHTGSDKSKRAFEKTYQEAFVKYQDKVQAEVDQQGFASEEVRLEMYNELENMSVARIKEIEKELTK